MPRPVETTVVNTLSQVGHAVDGLKFAGGSFSVHSRSSLRQLIDIAHEHGVYVSTGGWIEHVLTQARREGWTTNQQLVPTKLPGCSCLLCGTPSPAPHPALPMLRLLPPACHAFAGP